MSTRSRTEKTYEKAERILSDPDRVRTISSRGADFWIGEVRGDHGTYRACAVSPEYAERIGQAGEMVACRCRAARRGLLCSHAMVADEMRLRAGRMAQVQADIELLSEMALTPHVPMSDEWPS